MKRRKFLRQSIAGGAAIIAATSDSRATSKSPAGSRVDQSVTYGASARSFDLEEAAIAELQAGMRSGRFTARSLAEKYLNRIDEVDKRGPAINSVIEVNPDAIDIATA